MKITIKTARELKKFLQQNREAVKSINGVAITETYPMIECSNKHAMYYDVEKQTNIFLGTPFIVEFE